MDDVQRPVATALGMTALGRLHLRVMEDDGVQEVVVERRWAEAAAARSWCEKTVHRAAPDTTVLEIQVFEERWQHARSWETTSNRPVAETLQLGVAGPDGAIHWSESRPMSPHMTLRHVY
jgi:hypothetical protein